MTPIRLKVYLAGPIRACNMEQQTWWRKEMRGRLPEFDFVDPTELREESVVGREIWDLDACELVAANMWRESVGTTLGIVRAHQQGKPVVLIDPNRMDNSILNSLVAPEVPVRSMDEACKRLRELGNEFRPFTVNKTAKPEERFSPSKLARSVARACSAAGVVEAGFAEQISAPVIADLRRDGGRQGFLESKDIRAAVFARLDAMCRYPWPEQMQKRAGAVLDAWTKREKTKDPYQAIREAEDRAVAAEAEAHNWKMVAQNLLKHQPEVASEISTSFSSSGVPRFKNTDDVLKEVTKRSGALLVVHGEAKASGRRIKPSLSLQGLEDLYTLLDELGEFARKRAVALIEEVEPQSFEEVFGSKYAPTETKETKERYRKGEFYEYMGKKYQALPHLKMSDQGHEIRVYFDEISRATFLICELGHRKTFRHDG